MFPVMKEAARQVAIKHLARYTSCFRWSRPVAPYEQTQPIRLAIVVSHPLIPGSTLRSLAKRDDSNQGVFHLA